jgi:hypothetical protein
VHSFILLLLTKLLFFRSQWVPWGIEKEWVSVANSPN